jgi:GntR family transcriptional regulator of gluconate operon
MNYPSSWLQGASLGEKIAAELRYQIIKGIIPQGSILSENQIASEFETSRAPVRDCFKTLSNEGLIRLERMGAFVIGLSTRDMDELYDIRFLIENFVIQRLVEANNGALIYSLNKIIDKMKIAGRHHDHIELAYYDLAFHETIIKEAHHKRILHLWNNIRNIVLTALLVATQQRFSTDEHEMQKLIDKHRLLALSLSSKDGDYIGKILQDHFEDTRRTVNSSVRMWDTDK